MVGFSSPATAGMSETPFRHNMSTFFFSLAIAFGTFQYNLDTTIVNGLQASQGFLRVFGDYSGHRKATIPHTFQSLITSLLQVGLITASLSFGPFSRFYGRRVALSCASAVTCVALVIQITVTSRPPIYVARLLLGLANGFFVNSVILWLGESAPTHLRGSFVALFQVFQGLGGTLGAGISKALSTNLTKHSYQIQLATLFVVPLWFLVYPWFMPESPRWLVTRGRPDDALKSLRRIRGRHYMASEVEVELAAIQEAVEAERELPSRRNDPRLLPRRRTLLTCGCAVQHVSSGILLLVNYGTVFFQIASPGADAFIIGIILQACGLAGSLVGPFVARRFKRKAILVGGFAALASCLLITAAVNEAYPTNGTGAKNAAAGRALVGFVCVHQFVYNFSCGPLAWTVASELPSNRLRSLTMGFAMAVGFFCAWLVSFTSPYYLNKLGARVMWIWAGSAFLTLLWNIFFLPDTTGRSLEELDALFVARIPARKFQHAVLDPATGSVVDRRELAASSEEGSLKGEKDSKGEEARDEEATTASLARL